MFGFRDLRRSRLVTWFRLGRSFYLVLDGGRFPEEGEIAPAVIHLRATEMAWSRVTLSILAKYWSISSRVRPWWPRPVRTVAIWSLASSLSVGTFPSGRLWRRQAGRRQRNHRPSLFDLRAEVRGQPGGSVCLCLTRAFQVADPSVSLRRIVIRMVPARHGCWTQDSHPCGPRCWEYFADGIACLWRMTCKCARHRLVIRESWTRIDRIAFGDAAKLGRERCHLPKVEERAKRCQRKLGAVLYLG